MPSKIRMNDTICIEIQFNDELMDYISRSDKSISEDDAIAAFYN